MRSPYKAASSSSTANSRRNCSSTYHYLDWRRFREYKMKNRALLLEIFFAEYILVTRLMRIRRLAISALRMTYRRLNSIQCGLKYMGQERLTKVAVKSHAQKPLLVTLERLRSESNYCRT